MWITDNGDEEGPFDATVVAINADETLSLDYADGDSDDEVPLRALRLKEEPDEEDIKAADALEALAASSNHAVESLFATQVRARPVLSGLS